MIFDVQYKDFNYDYVNVQTFNRLLLSQEIRRFFRPSEKRWVNIYHDRIRGEGGDYLGSDRRQLNVTKQGLV